MEGKYVEGVREFTAYKTSDGHVWEDLKIANENQIMVNLENDLHQLAEDCGHSVPQESINFMVACRGRLAELLAYYVKLDEETQKPVNLEKQTI